MKGQYLIGVLSIVLAFAAGLFAQAAIPAGTILPVGLNSPLNSQKARIGQVVSGRIMQDVPLESRSRIPEGAKVIGHVVDVKNGRPTQISVRFDTLVVSRRKIPITTNLRALASMMAIEEAQIPTFGPDRGTSPYRAGGPVSNGLLTVGKPTGDEVLARPTSEAKTNCHDAVSGNDRPQAFWLFSSDACGAYGFNDLEIAHAGRSNPVGIITLASNHGRVNVRAGSGMLLRVD
jgi:hypothetical protein